MPNFTNVLLIANTVAGQGRAVRAAASLRRRLVDRGIECELRPTGGPADATRWAKEADAEGYDLVVAVGGDGTVQEVVEGLVRSERPVPLAHLPVGTANVIALALGLPWGTRQLAALIDGGRVQEFDVGRLPEVDRHFFLMAAIGYPARLLADSPRRLKNLFGILTYAVAAWRQRFRYGDVNLRLTSDEGCIHATAGTVLIANIGRVYRLPVRLDPATSAHDGLLDISVISSRTPWDLLKVVARLLTWRRPTRLLRRFRCRQLLVEADPPAPVQIDGEVIGTTPLAVEVLPSAVRIVVGAYRPPDTTPLEKA